MKGVKYELNFVREPLSLPLLLFLFLSLPLVLHVLKKHRYYEL